MLILEYPPSWHTGHIVNRFKVKREILSAILLLMLLGKRH